MGAIIATSTIVIISRYLSGLFVLSRGSNDAEYSIVSWHLIIIKMANYYNQDYYQYNPPFESEVRVFPFSTWMDPRFIAPTSYYDP